MITVHHKLGCQFFHTTLQGLISGQLFRIMFRTLGSHITMMPH